MFWGEVAGGADEHVGAGEAGFLEGVGDAEVEDAGSVVADDDVGWFEVAVDEAAGVDGAECFGEGGAEGA
ncbi:hypothetical protein GCM10027605_14380 [Micromonospora zhanjiangensis]